MNRREAEDYIYRSYLKAEKHWKREDPDSLHRKPELSRDLIRSLSAPDKGARASHNIVVTGSKGKGSVAVMMAQILNTKFVTGLMTSPHLLNFCERFCVGGQRMADQDFVRLMTEAAGLLDPIERGLAEDVCISPMGIQTILALLYFRERHTDINIFECGKGARYDDVNNLRRDYAVINSIFPEHLRELGTSIEKIAEDKSHVISGEEVCVYTAGQEPSVMEIIRERAGRLKVPVKCYGIDFRAENIRCHENGTFFDAVIDGQLWSDVYIPLLGDHQARNCLLALAICLDIFKRFDQYLFPSDSPPGDSCLFENPDLYDKSGGSGDSLCGEAPPSIRETILEALSHIGRPGRMEILSSHPFVLLDACIHRESAKEVLNILTQLGVTGATLIMGIPDDKDFAGTAQVLKPIVSKVILTKSQNPHYVFSRRQVDVLHEKGIDCIWTDCLKEALIEAGLENDNPSCSRVSVKETAPAGTPVIILGTTSLIGEMEDIKNKYTSLT